MRGIVRVVETVLARADGTGVPTNAKLVGDLAVGAAFEVGEGDETPFFRVQSLEPTSNRVPVKRRRQPVQVISVAAALMIANDQQLLRMSVTSKAAARIDPKKMDAADQPGSHRIHRRLSLWLVPGGAGLRGRLAFNQRAAIPWRELHWIHTPNDPMTLGQPITSLSSERTYSLFRIGARSPLLAPARVRIKWWS